MPELPTSGVLTSPNFPCGYLNDLDILQKIQVPENNTIWIRFTDFECQPGRDTVTLTDGDGTRLGFFDGGATSEDDWREEIVSNTSMVEVLFHTDGSATDEGWRLDWGKYKVSITILLLFAFFYSNGQRGAEYAKEWVLDVSQLPGALSQQP